MVRITPIRRLWLGLGAAFFFAAPYLEVKGNSLCRFDLERLLFSLGGEVYPVEELYLWGLAAGAGLFLFLGLTQILGRVWCGWGCPQTLLSGLAEAGARRLGLRPGAGLPQGPAGRQFLYHLFLLMLGMAAGWGTVSYFLPPAELFARLARGQLAGWPLAGIVVVAGVLYLDLAFIRRLFCRELCPYGRFQSALVDPGALALGLLPGAAGRCLHCQACLRACPMGIDIRAGMQVECINCALCRDACLRVMAGRREEGLIGYGFGRQGRGWRELINPRVGLIMVATLLLLAATAAAFNRRAAVSLTVTRNPASAARITGDGRLTSFWQGTVHNLGQTEKEATVSAYLGDGAGVLLKGPTRLTLGGGERRQLSWAVETGVPEGSHPLAVHLRLADPRQRRLAEKTIYITRP